MSFCIIIPALSQAHINLNLYGIQLSCLYEVLQIPQRARDCTGISLPTARAYFRSPNNIDRARHELF